MTAAVYARHGFPFFEMFEEPSAVHGDFGGVKSIAQLHALKENVVEPRVLRVWAGLERKVGLTNPKGPMRKFRTVKDLENEYGGYHVAGF
jgi:hypothetical protein